MKAETLSDYTIPTNDKKIILSLYQDADTEITFNTGDRNLKPITFSLPKPPDFTNIDGYGLYPQYQKFRRAKVLKRLAEINKNSDYYRGKWMSVTGKKDLKILDAVWMELHSNVDYYEEELEFIKKQWYYRLFGYWCFINGKPTYIDGWHYFYLNSWHIKEYGLPDYRSRDRRFFIFARNTYGDPDLFGLVYPKHRREGATSKASCINFCVTSSLWEVLSGIQSKSEDDARMILKEHITPAWRKLPFWWLPETSSSSNPAERIDFRSASRAIKGSSGTHLGADEGMGSSITTDHSGKIAYDGRKLFFYHGDEVGKTESVDIYSRTLVIRKCLATAGEVKIFGLGILTSTVGEMTKGGGANFKRLCDDSKYDERDDNNRTASGFVILFMPAYEGLDGFIDEYGESIIDKPTLQQLEFLKEEYRKEQKKALLSGIKLKDKEDHEYIGAKKHLENLRAGLKKKMNTGGKEASDNYYSEIRQNPLFYRECFYSGSTGNGIDIAKVNDQIDFLDGREDATVRGNFEWVDKNGKISDWHQGAEVNWFPDEEGKWYVSRLMLKKEACRSFYNDEAGWWEPANPGRFYLGADPFKFDKTQGTKQSKGAMAVFWAHDNRYDPPGKPMTKWKSHRFVSTYNFRAGDSDSFGEDLLKTIIYYGAMVNPEIDIPKVWEYLIKPRVFVKGRWRLIESYEGYLIYHIDPQGQEKITPGEHSNPKVKQNCFDFYQKYIKYHSKRERHIELLEQIRDIGGVDEMTLYDLFTAGGYGGNAAQSVYHEEERNTSEVIDLERIYRR